MDPLPFIANIDVAALLAELHLSDPHCNEGAIAYDGLAGGSPPLLVGSDPNSSSSMSSMGNVSPISLFEMDTLLTLDCSRSILESIDTPRQPTADGPCGDALPSPLIGSLVRDHSRYKTELCPEWQLTETCRFGERCEFAHGKQELRTSSENEAVAASLARLATHFSRVKATPTPAGRQTKGKPGSVAPPPACAAPLVVSVGLAAVAGLPVVVASPPAAPAPR
eukprot:EG_transcript_27729